MRFFTQQLRLFLIIAMVLSPVQHLFAMQTGMQADGSTAVVETLVATVVTTSDIAHNGMLEMLDEDCSKHSKSGNCQSSNQCGNCSLSLGISQITPKRAELNTQIQLAILDVSLYSADLSPDYRPPRYS